VATKVSDTQKRSQAEADWRVGLADERLRELLYTLTLCRYFDERMEALYRQGRLPGAIYSGRGQEGTHVGVASALRKDDSLFPTHRDLSAQLTKGLDVKRSSGAGSTGTRGGATATATSATGRATRPGP
jgi:TPP-dependent pyruvate/acetoin dehydrogenase alpha subunit